MQEDFQEPESSQEAAASEANEIPAEVRNMATLCHILALVGFVGPLVMWLLKKNEHGFIDEQGRASLNFQFTITIGYMVAYLLAPIGIGLILMIVLIVANMIFVIKAAMKTRKGLPANYPVSARFLV